MTNPKPKLRWYQYSLRSLFVLMTLVACACSWYAYEMNEATKRRAAIEEIEKLRGSVYYYDFSRSGEGKPPGRLSWLRTLHGDEHLGKAVRVDLLGVKITDTGLANLSVLTDLVYIELEGTPISNDGLVNLKPLANLDTLWLNGTQISDSGLVHLEGLSNLTYLSLSDTQITDAGLVSLKRMANLTTLDISFTKTTDEGVKNLQEALPNCTIAH